MTDKHQLILIAAYADLEAAQTDFRELEGRVKHGVELRSAALVTKGDDGEAQVLEAANRHGRMGTALGAGLGLLWGTLLVSFASTLGATLAMLSARYLLRGATEKRFGHRLTDINQGQRRSVKLSAAAPAGPCSPRAGW